MTQDIFVGRDTEMAALLDVYYDICDNQTKRIVTISGKEGIGKDAFVKTFLKRDLSDSVKPCYINLQDNPGQAEYAEQCIKALSDSVSQYNLLIIVLSDGANIACPDAVSIELKPLMLAEVAMWIFKALPDAELPKDFANRVFAISKGIPAEVLAILQDQSRWDETPEPDSEPEQIPADIKARIDEADSLYEQGIAAEDDPKSEKDPKEFFEKALDIYQSLNLAKDADIRNNLECQADCYIKLGEYEEDVEPQDNKLFAKAEQIFKDVDDKPSLGKLYVEMAARTSSKKHIADYSEKAMTLINPDDNTEDYLDMLSRYTMSLVSDHKKKALKLLYQMEEISGRDPEKYYKWLVESKMRIMEANAFGKKKDIAMLLDINAEIKRLNLKYGSARDFSQTLAREAELHRSVGEKDTARKLAQESIQVKIDANLDPSEIGISYFTFCSFFEDNDHKGKIRYMKEAVKWVSKSKSMSGLLTMVYATLSYEYERCCQYSKALECLDKSYEWSKKGNAKKAYIDAATKRVRMANEHYDYIRHKAFLLMDQGIYDQALEFLMEEYNDYSEEDRYADFAGLCKKISNCIVKMDGNLLEAAGFLEQAARAFINDHPCYREEQITCLQKAGLIYFDNGNKQAYNRIIQEIKDAMGTPKETDDFTYHHYLGMLYYSVKDVPACIDSYLGNLSVNLESDLCSRQFMSDTFNKLGECLLSDEHTRQQTITYNGKTQKVWQFAMEYLEQSTKLYETHLDDFFYLPAIKSMYTFYNEDAQYEKALEWIERGITLYAGKRDGDYDTYYTLVQLYLAKSYALLTIDPIEAEKFYDKALRYTGKIHKSSNLKAASYAQVCDYFFRIGNVKRAMNFAGKIGSMAFLCPGLEEKIRKQWEQMDIG